MSERETPDVRDPLTRFFADLRRTEPSSSLEDRVVETLRRQGLLAGSDRHGKRSTMAFLAAAAAILAVASFALGAFVGGPDQASVRVTDGMARYLLLLYEGDVFEAPAGAAEEYARWISDLRSAGLAATGAELASETKRLGEIRGVDPGEPRITGFFLINAPDLSAAIDIATGCPHLRYGGGIEVRPLALH